MKNSYRWLFILFGAAGLCAAQTQAAFQTPDSTPARPPQPAHIVIVMEENRSFDNILGPGKRSSLPYLNTLADGGANMTQSFAEGHNSELNYMVLFAGDPYTQNGTGHDQCPVDAGNTPNMAASLLAAGDGFAGYSEGLPSMGSTVCFSGRYARKHCPWVDFQVGGNVPVTCNLPFSAFPKNFNDLPAVSWVIPDLDHDMHDGSPKEADTWLKKSLADYADWCQDPSNKSLLIISWDEDDKRTKANQIPTIIYGAMVRPGKYPETINHYRILSTILDMYGISPFGHAVGLPPITDIFSKYGAKKP